MGWRENLQVRELGGRLLDGALVGVEADGVVADRLTLARQSPRLRVELVELLAQQTDVEALVLDASLVSLPAARDAADSLLHQRLVLHLRGTVRQCDSYTVAQ